MTILIRAKSIRYTVGGLRGGEFSEVEAACGVVAGISDGFYEENGWERLRGLGKRVREVLGFSG